MLLVGLGVVVGLRGDSHAQAWLPEVLVRGDPVEPPILLPNGQPRDGIGLCAAYRSSPLGDPMPDVMWGTQPIQANLSSTWFLFPEKINEFMDRPTPPRAESRMSTLFDLSNYWTTPMLNAIGDYTNETNCADPRGCPFPAATDDMQSRPFASRFRGFLQIGPGDVGSQLHFGFFSDDSVAMMIWDVERRDGNRAVMRVHPVVSRAASIQGASWRLTNRVTFMKPGLYPVEIVAGRYYEAGVLEFAILRDNPSFSDIEQPAAPMMMGLKAQNFKLIPPTMFFQSTRFFRDEANPREFDYFPFKKSAPDKCQQCSRQYAGDPKQGRAAGCEPAYYCNEAALCAPCLVDNACGASCSPCEAPTPYCVPARSGDMECAECRDDNDCSRGKKCVAGKCTSKCLCCDDDKCVALNPKEPGVRTCVECVSDAQCDGRRCDTLNGRCVDKLPECATDDRCGTNCVDCKTVEGNRPYCLNGQVCVQCKSDFDCPDKRFCLSGSCVPCNVDRHCGPKCQSCGVQLALNSDGTKLEGQTQATPFCYSPDMTVENATCVRCFEDKQCGDGGKCNLEKHECENKCEMTCPGNQVCDGTRCVECYTNAQCPCGSCVDGSCTPKCRDSSDCGGNQCCNTQDGLCIVGRCGPGVARGGALCCSATGTAPPTADGLRFDVEGGEAPTVPGRSLALATVFSLLAYFAFRRSQRLRLGNRGVK